MSLPQPNDITIKQDFELKVLNDTEIQICDLGSCQYKVINNVINFLLEWDEMYSDLQEMFEDLGFNVSFKKIRTVDDVRWELIDVNQFKDQRGDRLGMQYECEKIIRFCKSESFDDIFLATRKSAWDLWTAAHSIGICTFEDLQIEVDTKTPTFGPKWNQIAQDQGIVNGIQCFLFLKFNLIKDIECLKDFDT